MYTRDYKQFFEGGIYHIYNRGNNKQPIFLEDSDYQFFLLRLKEYLTGNQLVKPGGYARKLFNHGSFSLICYCLMPNHFHFSMVQNSNISIDKFVQRIMTSYVKYFNNKYDRVGHLFQDQFKIKHVPDDEYFKWLFKYIHLNPIEAGLVAGLNHYKWSSYHEYLQGVSSLCDFKPALNVFGEIEDVEKFLST